MNAGEIAALDLLEKSPDGLFLCDDAAARLAAESLGFRVHGTIGLIVRAIRRGTRTAAQAKAIKLLWQHQARRLGDLRAPPGNRLEVLKGNRAGQHSIRINDQWRICFHWEGTDAHAVEIIDYH